MIRDRPLFVPLRREYFEAFERGEKNVEIRKYGRRWTERTCYEGRPVVLSLGYSGARRMRAVIALVTRRYPRGSDEIAFFGENALLIVMALSEITPLTI